jgi:hypothetical protein
LTAQAVRQGLRELGEGAGPVDVLASQIACEQVGFAIIATMEKEL